MGRFTILAAVSALLVAGIALPAQAGRSSHPYFDDQGTLTWYHRLDDAKRAARAEGKVIFVEYGRRRCGSCRVLVSSVLTDRRVRSRMSKAAVGLAAECDRPEPTIQRMFSRHLAGARMLPFVAFLTADGEYITGFAGGSDANRFLVHLRKAEARVSASRRPAPRPEVRRPPQSTPRRPATRREPPAAPPSNVRPTARTPEPAPAPAPAPAPRPPRITERPVQPRTYPAPSLAGDPDAADVRGPDLPAPRGNCVPPILPRRTGPLPPPKIIINPPVKVSRERAVSPPPRSRSVTRTAPMPTPAKRLQDQAREAARKGDWGTVLRLTDEVSGDPRLDALRRQAHAWAQGELETAVLALSEERYEEALAAVKDVLLKMQGEPEAVDAESGLVAIRTMLELRFLNAEGPVAPVVRQNTYEELRGTRWAALFSS